MCILHTTYDLHALLRDYLSLPATREVIHPRVCTIPYSATDTHEIVNPHRNPLFPLASRFLSLSSLPHLTGSMTPGSSQQTHPTRRPVPKLSRALANRDMSGERPACVLPHDPASPAELEELVRATKLCKTCRPIFDPALQEKYDVNHTSPFVRRSFKHHDSVETLRHCVHAGCRICTMLSERWARYSESEPRDCGGVSFIFYATSDEIQVQGVLGSEYFDTILWLEMGECKTRLLSIPLRPVYAKV